MKKFAQQLRKKSTESETKLWQFLRNRKFHGYKFRRQHVIDKFIVDFVCIEKKLVIELDGGQHSEQIAYDAKRTMHLEKLGFKVIRFWDDEIFTETDAVHEVIYENLMNPHLPAGTFSRKREKGDTFLGDH